MMFNVIRLYIMAKVEELDISLHIRGVNTGMDLNKLNFRFLRSFRDPFTYTIIDLLIFILIC